MADVSTELAADIERGAWPFGPMTDADLHGYIDEVLAEETPRRFALFGVTDDRKDAGLIGWGVAFDDAALLWIEGDHPTYIHCRSADTIRDRFDGGGEVVLRWADPDPSAR